MPENNLIAPSFPLHLFLLPGEDAPLQIFEPRYIALVNDCREQDCTFVIPFNRSEEKTGMGTEVRISQVVAEQPDGRMVVVVEALRQIKVLERGIRTEKLYKSASYRSLEISDAIESLKLLEEIEAHRTNYNKEFLDCCMNASVTMQDVLKALSLTSEEKYLFYMLGKKHQQERFLLSQITYLNMIRRQEQILGSNFALN